MAVESGYNPAAIGGVGEIGLVAAADEPDPVPLPWPGQPLHFGVHSGIAFLTDVPSPITPPARPWGQGCGRGATGQR